MFNYTGCIFVGVCWGVTNPFLKSGSEKTSSSAVYPSKIRKHVYGIKVPFVLASLVKYFETSILPYLTNLQVCCTTDAALCLHLLSVCRSIRNQSNRIDPLSLTSSSDG